MKDYLQVISEYNNFYWIIANIASISYLKARKILT